MKGSVKLFIASLVILAAAIGFFAGSMMNKPCAQNLAIAEGSVPPPPGMDDQVPPPPDMKGPHGPGHKGPHGKFGKGPDFAVIDSILQVTPEQKTALEQQRNQMDSSFKDQRKQKMDAEKALREALDNNNDEQINIAKRNIMAIQEKMLDSRIQGSKDLAKILSKEQMTKLHEYQKDMFKKHKKGPGPKKD